MISYKNIETIAKRAYEGEPVQILEYRFSPFSKEKIGFTSDYQTLDLTVKGDQKTETKRFFVKKNTESSAADRPYLSVPVLFAQESMYFKDVYTILHQNFKGENWCPQCYLADETTIVLEDLRIKNFAMAPEKKFNTEHLRLAVKCQARIHAASLLAEARLGINMYEFYSKKFQEQVFNIGVMSLPNLLLQVKLIEYIIAKDGRKARGLRTGILRGYKYMQQRFTGKNSLQNVICHGDAWPNNYLFDLSYPPKVIMVDFQFIRYGPRTSDISLLMYLSTTRDERQRVERLILKDYCEELCSILKKNNPHLPRPSFEEILEEYEDVRLSMLTCSLFYYPLVYIDSDDFVKFVASDDIISSIVFRSNNNIIFDMCENNPKYLKKLGEIAHEFADYCESQCFEDEDNNITKI